MRDHVVTALSRYWKGKEDVVRSLPISDGLKREIQVPLRLVSVALPSWAAEWGVEGNVLVPAEAVGSDSTPWDEVDWWSACFLMLECWHERVVESTEGTIQSYSFRLADWDTRIWDRAWLNRIALFLREWAFQGKEAPALPEPEVILTHDVDAVRKTAAIRIKQGLFGVFNGLKALKEGAFLRAGGRIKKAVSFALGFDDWWTLDKMMQQQQVLGIRSVFHFAADRRTKTPKRWLFDPNYDIETAALKRVFAALNEGGWVVGLHPSFDSWDQAELLGAQRKHLESASGSAVTWNRQHWLRFSYTDTWSAQQEAGIAIDSTLMFNDRPGFRASYAGQWRPWDPEQGNSMTLEALASVLMDSHLYDYADLTDPERKESIDRWLTEVEAVRGRTAVLWHPQTLTKDYDWSGGYNTLLERMASIAAKPVAVEQN